MKYLALVTRGSSPGSGDAARRERLHEDKSLMTSMFWVNYEWIRPGCNFGLQKISLVYLVTRPQKPLNVCGI